MDYGSKPADGGFLIINQDDKDKLNEFELGFIKKYIGADDFINGINRYCLWINDEEYSQALNSDFISDRIEAVKDIRNKSKKNATKKDAAYPYKFSEIRYKESECIIIPRHSSERREYIPIGYLDAGTVVADSAFAIYDAPKWLFAVLTSKMHMAWVKTVGGRLETRYRYSAQLCYNTFPFPAISELQKAELEKLAQEVLDIRDEHFDMTPGEKYNPETMPDDLKDVHRRLDLSVERCYRLEPFTSDEERLECLFNLYVKMTKK